MVTKDITGEKFNQLTAIEFVGADRNYEAIWVFQCDCGNVRQLRASSVRSGNTKSCGCAQKKLVSIARTKHGKSKKRIYTAYQNMIRRCYGNAPRHIRHYQSKGITVCDEWLKSVDNFAEWAYMNGYADTLTLDRIDGELGYSPNNCRWVTQAEQMKNVSSNIRITISGETKILAEWARILGASSMTIRKHMQDKSWLDQLLNKKMEA